MNKLPLPVLITIFCFMFVALIGFLDYAIKDLQLYDILAIFAFICVFLSLAQDNIHLLRVFSLVAGICFCIQFFIVDLYFNLLGQLILCLFTIYKLTQETK